MGVRGVFSYIYAPEEKGNMNRKGEKRIFCYEDETEIHTELARYGTLFFEGGERSRFPTIIQTAQIRQRKTN
jgi:hypothetical protein